MKVWVRLVTASAAGVVLTCGGAAASQWIVLGTNGQVLDVDPLPYLPDARRQRKRDEARRLVQEAEERERRAKEEAKRGFHSQSVGSEEYDRFFDDEEDEVFIATVADAPPQSELPDQLIPDIETLPLTSEGSVDADWQDDTDMKGGEDRTREALDERLAHLWPSGWMVDIAKVLEDDSGFPAVQGSVVFAELSCAFVAFIAYMVRAMPLWPSFSTGQKGCLSVAFGAATLYQFVVASWYMGSVSSDIMLGLSSFITRMISLGMVPITTTSFLGRARLAAAATAAAYEEQEALEKQNAVVASKSSRHRHARARSS